MTLADISPVIFVDSRMRRRLTAVLRIVQFWYNFIRFAFQLFLTLSVANASCIRYLQ
jgi:hypothetical protein